MADLGVQKGPQLPVDAAGKVMGAYPVVLPDGTTVYVGATVVVGADGFEVGSALTQIVSLLQELVTTTRRVRIGLEMLIGEEIPEDDEVEP